MLLVRAFYGSKLWTGSEPSCTQSTVASLKNVFVIIVRAVTPSVLTPSKSPAPPGDAAHCPQHPARPNLLRGEGPEAHPLPSGPFGRLAIQSPLTVTFHPPRSLSATTRQVPHRSISCRLELSMADSQFAAASPINRDIVFGLGSALYRGLTGLAPCNPSRFRRGTTNS